MPSGIHAQGSSGLHKEESLNRQLRASLNEGLLPQCSPLKEAHHSKGSAKNPYVGQGQATAVSTGNTAPGLGQTMPSQHASGRYSFKNSHTTQQFTASGKHNLRHLQESIAEKRSLGAERTANSKSISSASAQQNHASTFHAQ